MGVDSLYWPVSALKQSLSVTWNAGTVFFVSNYLKNSNHLHFRNLIFGNPKVNEETKHFNCSLLLSFIAKNWQEFFGALNDRF